MTGFLAHLRFPILPFGRRLRQRRLPKCLGKLYRLDRLAFGDVCILALDCSEKELSHLHDVCTKYIAPCLSHCKMWFTPSSCLSRLQICVLGSKAEISYLPNGVRMILDGSSRHGCFDSDTLSAFVKFIDEAPLSSSLVHELFHAWTASVSGCYPFPLVIEEGFARAVERACECRPLIYELHQGITGGAYLESNWSTIPFFSIRELLGLWPAQYESLDNLAMCSVYWETDALIAFLFKYCAQAPGLVGFYDLLRSFPLRRDNRTLRLAQLCNMTIERMESEFVNLVRGGDWVPFGSGSASKALNT